MRINQYLAYCLGISRRKAEEPVLNGQVKLNGQVVKDLFTKVEEGDRIEFLEKGQWKSLAKKSAETILVYKPTFCVSTKSDPQGRRTIYDVLPKKYQHLKNAGRLDFMSEGLLVLSSNGQLVQELTHPRHNHIKIYLAGLNKPFSSENLKRINTEKIILDEYELQPVKVEEFNLNSNQEQTKYLKLSEKLYWYRFTLTEGRNLQIRKLCQMYGTGVTRLIRIQQGKFELTPDLVEQKIIEV
ncbi:MAG: pseudouridine synthase [Patescibacteria group bacterium]